ncbi:alkylation response protein AidB-like acyl-CoA dehydrogenase [Curtobacterium sp. PhB130]|uniref:acyl-CoA dehydrogenase family protein n=1 Tax=Curtobacterium sp. PhB130 TaxID=2485178 RepID=UPI000F4C1334|nr:acyl-CoA dehydrogenase family protein [Curtobacterium sp. PhB130]ROS78032.1 alkylation response protein AidB-like acyl-CoA dehydrogenase [Curtobacterium sp. PhB130]
MTITAPVIRTSLLEQFAPVFDRIADGAVDREQTRTLPHEQVRWLADAGFTAVTVPVAAGGSGASASDLFALLVRLAEADSNIPQLLRAHFSFVEELLLDPGVVRRDEWFTRIAAGEVFGNASHERSGAGVGSLATHLVPDGDGWRLHGEKHYSTGTIFADWTTVTAQTPDGHTVGVTVRVDDPGVEVRDDWNGFGQRLTGSGTTRFDGVRVELWQLRPERGERRTVLPAFLQTVLLASLAGVAAAASRDAAAFVRSRTRHYQHGVGATAASDPLVQSVVGRIAADAVAAEALVLSAAAAIDEAHDAIVSDALDAGAHIDAAELRTIALQSSVVELALRATTTLFEVGGASATDRDRSLDRHWRNARTLSSHNPVVFQQRVIGDHLVNGAPLTYFWATGEAR